MRRSTTATTAGYRHQARLAGAAALLGAIFMLLSVVAPNAQAAGSPDIELSKETPGEVLFGEQAPVTLRVSNPAGQPTGYNVSFRDVLPVGVSYVPGSAPASVGDPREIANAPGTGQTTLLWENVTDLTPNSEFALTFRVAHSAAALAVGETYTNQAGAYINCAERYVPDFDENGLPIQTTGEDCTGSSPDPSFTGWATDSAVTEITAIEIEKDEPSPEGELLRGLHDNQTVYTLTVRNNRVNPTGDLRVEDYLPAGLEFLGCGGNYDNTTDAATNRGETEEYPGSGPINPGNAPASDPDDGWANDCLQPDLVETVQDPVGLPSGVYTRVVWESALDDLAAAEELTITYLAAIPFRENTMDWTGAVPTPESLGQGANLDNNSGPQTTDEQALTNYGFVAGSYQAPGQPDLPVSDDTELTRIAEDLRLLKTVTPERFGVGVISRWNLRLDTSEYRYAEDVVITDTLANGYCPLNYSGNLENPIQQDPECNAVPDEGPLLDYSSATENANGTWELTWSHEDHVSLRQLGPSTWITIGFSTRTRAHLQQDYVDAAPILAHDRGRNDVSVVGETTIICAGTPAAPCPEDDPGKIITGADLIDTRTDIDDSAAFQDSDGPTIEKLVAPTANVADCSAVDGYGDAAPLARPGDTVCWRLIVTFPDDINTGGVTVTDFIPPGSTYVAGSTEITSGQHTATITTPNQPEPVVEGSRLAWTLDDSNTTVNPTGVFDVTFAVEVERLPGRTDGDIVDNLMKVVYSNTAEQTFPLRDLAPFDLAQAEVGLVKGVFDINGEPAGGNPANTDGGLVSAEDVVTYRVDVTNTGRVVAQNVEVWDVLPAQIDCSMVDPLEISHAGTCVPGAEDRIVWTIPSVAADGGSVMLTYDVEIPDQLASGERLDNTAGVRVFQSPSGDGPYPNIPADNIDPTQNPSANAPPAKDPSWVEVEEIDLTKTRTTEIDDDDAGNGVGQATIGEEIYYTVTATIPEGTSFYGDDTALVDELDDRFTLVTGTAAATVDFGDGNPVQLPTTSPDPELDLTETADGGVQIDFPNPYHNPVGSGDDIIVLTYTVQVADEYPDNYAKGTPQQRMLPNTATLNWETETGVEQSEEASTGTEIVEPDVSIGKASDADALLTPGQIVEYTLTISNGSAVRVSAANDTVVVDTIPERLDPVNGATPVDDGDPVNPDGGIWDEDNRTITWSVGDLDPGESVDVTYSVRVSDDSIGAGGLTNTARVTTTSMPGDVDGERDSSSPADGYDDEDSLTGNLIAGEIGKTGVPDEATIGQRVKQTITVQIPAGITQYDVSVIDDLPDGLIFGDYIDEETECTVGCDIPGSAINPDPLDDVANGNGQTIGWFLGDITARPDAPRTVVLVYWAYIGAEYGAGGDVSDGDELVNEATLVFNETDQITVPPNTPPDPDDFDQERETSWTTDVIEPTLSLTKTVAEGSNEVNLRDTDPGESYDYTVTITNDGTAPAYDVAVSDEPDVELENVVVAAGDDWTIVKNWSEADRRIQWLIPGPIAPGDSVVLTYTADLIPSPNLSDGDEVDNTADVPSYWGVPEEVREDPGNSDIEYREYDDVDPDSVKLIVRLPSIVVDKTTGAAGFPDNADAAIETPFTWRVVITNPNTPSILNGVDLTDTLPPNWSYVPGSAVISGSGELTLDPPDPDGKLEPASIIERDEGDQLVWENIANLAGGENVIVTFQAVPSVEAVFEPGIGVAHVNDAEAEGEDVSGETESGDGPYRDDDDATGTLLTPVADLAITKVARDHTPPAGSEVIWDLTVTNKGPQSAPSVHVSDTLPAGLGFVSAVPEQGSCSESAGSISCELGVIGPNETVTIVLTTLVAADTEGQVLVNPAEVEDPMLGDDPTPGDNRDEDEVTPRGLADLSIQKQRLADLVASQRGTYRLTVRNAGPSVARDVVVTDTLPDNLRLVDVRPSAGTCDSAGQAIECDLGDLAPGAVVVIEVEVDVLRSGDTTNLARVTSPTPDPDPDNNEDGDTTDPSNTDLAIAKTGPANFPVGVDRHYRLQVTNVGQTASGGLVTVSDQVPAVLGVRAAAGQGWACDIAGQLVTCQRDDSLAPGQSFPEILITVQARRHLGFAVVRNSAQVSLLGDPISENNADVAATERGGICIDGNLRVAPRIVWVGRQTRLIARVTRPDGGPAAGVQVRLRGNGKAGARRGALTARTNGKGLAAFRVGATGPQARWLAFVGPCELRAPVRPRVQPTCRAMQVNPRSILPGQVTPVRVRLKAPDGGPLVGVPVTARGPGVNVRSRTNKRGVAVLRMSPSGPGTITVRAPGSVRCSFTLGAADVADAGDHLTG